MFFLLVSESATERPMPSACSLPRGDVAGCDHTVEAGNERHAQTEAAQPLPQGKQTRAEGVDEHVPDKRSLCDGANGL